MISNRDIGSLQTLDLWLDHIATGEVLPLIAENAAEYSIPALKDLISPSHSSFVVRLVQEHDLGVIRESGSSVEDFGTSFDLLSVSGQQSFLSRCFDYILGGIADLDVDWNKLLPVMVKSLETVPALVVRFTRVFEDSEIPQSAASFIQSAIPTFLKACILCANDVGELILNPFKFMLARLPNRELSPASFSDLVRLVALAVRSAELAMDLLLGILEAESGRILRLSGTARDHFVRDTMAVALDHIGEASENYEPRHELLSLENVPAADGEVIVEVVFRVDSPAGPPEKGFHVRLTVASLPENVYVGPKHSIDALTIHSERGLARFECLHPLPPYFRECSWRLHVCAVFTTHQTMLDAVLQLATDSAACLLADLILGQPETNNLALQEGGPTIKWQSLDLNPGQNIAVQGALESRLLCLWGPPGTGKTETIVQMLLALQSFFANKRILVTAPTHNAVDNVMRRYLSRAGKATSAEHEMNVLRVSTSVSTFCQILEHVSKYNRSSKWERISGNTRAMLWPGQSYT